MAGKIQEVKDSLDHCLRDDSKPWSTYLTLLERKTGIDRLYSFLGFVSFIGLYLVFGYGGQLICNLICFGYPAYASIKAIESNNKEDDTKWLTYWVCFAFFSVAEFFADLIVGWFPLYWLSKCFFLIWLMMPTEFNGSLILYKRVIRPYFLKHQTTIDATINNIKETASKAAKIE